MNTNLPLAEYWAWNPGLQSQLPREYLPLSTIFCAENVSTTAAKAYELSDFCGLPTEKLVAFRVERLIVHELLIHVASGIAVPDGRDYEDLGRNFREIAATILNQLIVPHREELARVFEQLKQKASDIVERELTSLSARPKMTVVGNQPGHSRWLFAFNKSSPEPSQPLETVVQRDQRIISEWRQKAHKTGDRLKAGCFAALHKVATAVISQRGRLLGDKDLLRELAVTLLCNDFGSEMIGEAILPFVREAVAHKGYRLLPRQEKPVVMNVKGAPASGKSTMRPLQKVLAGKINLPWDEFALISPDIWRKFLLDYTALGAAYKYAGTLTGHEVEIIDRKLDRRMANRAARGEIPHLLIDRFRFDSFVPNLEEGSGRLLTRFGNLVYMFFMITPPQMTVERAWTRGVKVGRYKAVEDILAQNVEAFSGMPELFFMWALIGSKLVHLEFLDNSVAEGRPPRTVAFGWNGEMTILDIKSMINIERFRKINIRAERAADVYANMDLSPQRNLDFLKRCVRWIPAINFGDYQSGQIYARLQRGNWVWLDQPHFDKALEDPEANAALVAIARNVYSPTSTEQKHTDVARKNAHDRRLGRGSARPKSRRPNALKGGGVAMLTFLDNSDQGAENRRGPVALFPQPNDDVNLALMMLNLALLVALRRPNPFLNIQLLVATGVSEAKRINAMATLKTDAEEILTFDVSDEALESAGTVGNKTNFTFGVCTLDQPGCFPSMIPNEGQ